MTTGKRCPEEQGGHNKQFVVVVVVVDAAYTFTGQGGRSGQRRGMLGVEARCEIRVWGVVEVISDK